MKRSDMIERIQSASDAITEIVKAWEKGDLAEAVNHAQAVNESELKPALAWWASDE